MGTVTCNGGGLLMDGCITLQGRGLEYVYNPTTGMVIGPGKNA
jgi:hypothetical protein